MHHERRSRAASGSECEAIDDAEAPRDCELQLGRQVKECHASFASRLVCSRLVCTAGAGREQPTRQTFRGSYRNSAVLDEFGATRSRHHCMPKAAEAAYAPKANPSDPLALKKEGNEHFKRGSFESAAKCYTTAIDLWLEPKDRAVLYVNRSAARMKQAPEPGCTAAALAESALRDAERAIDLDASYPKGFFRRAQALVALGRHVDAAASLATVLSLSPGDAAAQALLLEVERKLPSVPEAERALAWEAAARGAVGEVVERESRPPQSPASSREFVTGATPPRPPATNGS